jgi:hypothetical protein
MIEYPEAAPLHNVLQLQIGLGPNEVVEGDGRGFAAG